MRAVLIVTEVKVAQLKLMKPVQRPAERVLADASGKTMRVFRFLLLIAELLSDAVILEKDQINLRRVNPEKNILLNIKTGR